MKAHTFQEGLIPRSVQRVMEYAIENNLPVLLQGETGTGKTSYVEAMAARHNAPYYRINLNGQSNIEEILGKWLIDAVRGTYWIDGQVTHAVRNGGFLVVDEINAAAPEILFSLHELLDDARRLTLHEKDREVITPHANFRLFATMNPNYAGTKELNRALVSRFRVGVTMPYLDKKAEIKILKKDTNISDSAADILVSLSNDLRKAYQQRSIQLPVTLREMLTTAAMIKAGIGMGEALRFAVVEKLEPEDQPTAQKIIALYIKTPNAKKQKKSEPEESDMQEADLAGV